MARLTRYIATALLVLTSFVCGAQETISKGDLPDPRASVDQNPVSIGDVPIATTTPGRTRIVAHPSSVNAEQDRQSGRIELQEKTPEKQKAPEQLNDFQNFLFENTGTVFPVFGSEFFEGAPSTFAPIGNNPVPSDYPLGPGDQIVIRGTGAIEIDATLTIDRNGRINLPSIGPVQLAGVQASQAERVVQSTVDRFYRGVKINVSFGQLRAITIYVVGQASHPGTYTVSSASTLISALFASGGPNRNGSLRHIQLRRNGRTEADLDLYAFIANGNKTGDLRLLDGDTVYIPPARGYVALIGKVNQPAIYELSDTQETLGSILEKAGGMSVLADPHRVYMERIDNSKNKPRSVQHFDMERQLSTLSLQNGDVLNFLSLTPQFENAVTLRGNVDQPLRVPFRAGMKVRDLIPGREFLVRRKSLQLQNSTARANISEGSVLAASVGNLLDEPNWDYAVVERVRRPELKVELLPFNLGQALDHPEGPENVELRPGDTVTVFSQDDIAVPAKKRKVIVRVEGEVAVPGVYQMTPGDTVHQLLVRAGGPTNDAYVFGTGFYREQVRIDQTANLARTVERFTSQIQQQQSQLLANSVAANSGEASLLAARRQADQEDARAFLERLRALQPTGRIALKIDPDRQTFAQLPRLKLENGDRLVIPKRPDFVYMFGAINLQSSLLWEPGLTVGDYLNRAGISPEADEDHIAVLRADGSVANYQKSWLSPLRRLVIMPGDVIMVPPKGSRESGWTRFIGGVKDLAQILANFGLGAAAIKTLR